ncbi:MAG: hypothetical protein ABJA79_01575 [Parafilimonas sp.]
MNKNILAVKSSIIFLSLFLSAFAQAQDTNGLLNKAVNFEHQFKEAEALEVYKQIASIEPSNVNALVKCTELTCSIGARETEKSGQYKHYKIAEEFAKKAITVDANNADANYAMALVYGKISRVEPDTKIAVSYVKQTKIYVDKTLAINPNHAKANYIAGMWHYKIENLSWVKKVAAKTFYSGLPKANTDSAIYYLEKCKSIQPYFAENYLYLAKAYELNRGPAKEIDVLNKLIKLPNRTYDDAAIKAEGKKMLEEMQ